MIRLRSDCLKTSVAYAEMCLIWARALVQLWDVSLYPSAGWILDGSFITFICCKIAMMLGSGCDSVGRAVASDTRGPWFESSHRQKFIYTLNICLLSTVHWKNENKEKWPGMALFKNCIDVWKGRKSKKYVKVCQIIIFKLTTKLF